MELVLEKSLEHQQRAVDAVADVFAGVRIDAPAQYYANPVLDLADPNLIENVAAVQTARNVPSEMRGATKYPHAYLPLDVKMETGTGKTYVYTKTIFELHRRYGFNKFIVAVPSLAIKAGTSQFMTDGAARKHFADVCGYDATLDVQVLEAAKSSKKTRRESFPAAVWEFVKATKEARRRISVLVVNMQLLSNAKMLEKEYDSMFENMRRPFDALKSTHPIVIIDEPHRFERSQKAYEKIEKEIAPQCVIRFGATFPEVKIGGKKGQPKPKDYRNLLYDLNACSAFNDGLVKGINKEHLESPEGGDELVRLIATETRESARFQLVAKGRATKTFELKEGDSLGLVHTAFEGIELVEIGANAVKLSNGLVRKLNDPLAAGPHLKSYQDGMLQLALDRHFETERENFRRGTKIKTLALFFISDIRSYRDKDGYLRERFERYLKVRIEKSLAELTPSEADYRAFLEASAANLSLCHGGYFAEDKTAADEATAQEVEEILFGKKQLLSFKDATGKWNVRRFLFSKWTLREGWDNPNVFTIAKLRSCGSETSLLQEVGRGLRLPVDENGNRVSGEDFRLNYIVDFTEADFAERLVSQINAEVVTLAVINEEKLEEVAKKRKTTSTALFAELLTKGLVDINRKIVPERQGVLIADYPEFAAGAGLKRGTVRDRNKKPDVRVHVRKEQFAALKGLWEKLNQRYMLFFKGETGDMLEKALPSLWENDVFVENTLQSQSQRIQAGKDGLTLVNGSSSQYRTDERLAYGVFLKRLFAVTHVPVKMLHDSLCSYAKAHEAPKAEWFTESTIVNFKSALDSWKVENLQGFIHYEHAAVPVVKTELTNADGTVVAEISQGRIGRHLAEGEPSVKYLYDAKAYDSDLELADIGCDAIDVPEVESVTVYGKIPTKSVAIPTIMGGTYSPDFMYVVKRKGGKKELNVVIEVKDVEKEADLHKSEDMKIKCAEVFYNMLREDGIDVRYQKQLKNQKLRDIIAQVIEKSNGPEIKVEVEDSAKFKTHLPIYSMNVLCGPLADGQEVEADGWVKVEGHGKLDPTQFVVRTKGVSMEGLIPDGAMCVMRKLGGGDLEGKTILVQRNDASDPENGGAYTIKTFTRKGKKVVLKAKDPKYDIPLKDDAEYGQKYRAIAEFKRVF